MRNDNVRRDRQPRGDIEPVSSPLTSQREETLPGYGSQNDVDAINGILRARRIREGCFPPDLFSDPAWDALLELYLAGARQQRVQASSLCIDAGVPLTTTVRWIKRLVETGHVQCRSNPLDARVRWVELTEDGRRSMRRFIDRLGNPGRDDGGDR